MCAAFSLIDYKVEGQTFEEAILDLRTDTGGGKDSHRKFCSRNVQLWVFGKKVKDYCFDTSLKQSELSLLIL
jgi:hypothetical protein